MLELLHLKNVGPAPEMKMELGPRLNFITGDNGLGKSFLLDTAFWALTRKWPAEVNPKLGSGAMARPRGTEGASIAFQFTGDSKPAEYRAEFDREKQAWRGKAGRPSNPGLVLYAHADGGFSLWDPSRNYWWKEGGVDVQHLPPAYVFTANEVWEGLKIGTTLVCTGLLYDWILWQSLGGEPFRVLERVLEVLSPPGGPAIKPGPFVRLGLDARDFPSLTMPDGLHVPLVHVSAGIRRAVALAYLLVWAWKEHEFASREVGKPLAKQIILLVDEPEAHLHPRWQRAIVPALLEVVKTLTGDAGASMQLIAATHSPLVLASAEPSFNVEKDRLFSLDLVENTVSLHERPWAKQDGELTLEGLAKKAPLIAAAIQRQGMK